jgi:hypothetical protein
MVWLLSLSGHRSFSSGWRDLQIANSQVLEFESWHWRLNTSFLALEVEKARQCEKYRAGKLCDDYVIKLY